MANPTLNPPNTKNRRRSVGINRGETVDYNGVTLICLRGGQGRYDCRWKCPYTEALGCKPTGYHYAAIPKHVWYHHAYENLANDCPFSSGLKCGVEGCGEYFTTKAKWDNHEAKCPDRFPMKLKGQAKLPPWTFEEDKKKNKKKSKKSKKDSDKGKGKKRTYRKKGKGNKK